MSNENGYRLRMRERDQQRAIQPQAAAASTDPEGIPRVRSEALLGTARELIIEHGGREYRLRVTQNGKLILTA